MIFGGIISLVLALLALFLVWSQNNRIKVLEFELRALQKAFMAMRDRLAETGPQSTTASESETVSEQDEPEGTPPETAPTETADEAAAHAEPWGSQTGEPATEEDEPASVELEPIAASVAGETISEPAAPAKPDIETALGGRWAVWVGGLALALGGVFLVRYSIEAGLLGPKIRLALAAILGIAAAGGGEYLRRSGLKVPLGGINGAYLPGILTAAGAFILFGTVYAAHGLYGFIGPAMAFVLLGVVSVAAIALSLLHGQAFGGLGLLGSLATPALVSSDAPNPWALFGFLAIVLVATTYVARISRWWPMFSAAIAGTGLWCLAYLFASPEISVPPVVFITLVPIAALLLIWQPPGDDDLQRTDLLVPAIVTAIAAGFEMLGLAVHSAGQTDMIVIGIAAIIVVMLAAAVWRSAALPLLVAAGSASILWQLWAYFGDVNVALLIDGVVVDGDLETHSSLMTPVSALVAFLFLATGIWQARRLAAGSPLSAATWALLAVLLPLLVTVLLWTGFGNINKDIGYALLLAGLAAVLLAGAEMTARSELPDQPGGLAVSVLASGTLASLLIAIHAGFGPGMTTVLCGIAIAVPAVGARYRKWQILPMLSVAASFVVIGRIAIDPSIVGAFDLGKTPVFNWLLPGYAIPALGAGFAAWYLKRHADGRMRFVQEAFAALFTLLTAAILVRHAMNGGQLHGGGPSLAEQAIYTLIAIGGGAILVALDTRSPSPVFRIGSMAIGALSMLFIVAAHFVTLNPLVTNESTGTITFFNLLLLAYLLPAAAMAGLALYARPKRPRPYVACLGLTAAALAFTYVTLSIRRVYWGEFIGSWKGLTEWETYTYSAAWLALGVVILVIGIRLKSTVLRLASAALIVVAVAKVFLFDMSQLEGALRALSFIGLGAVLIGIGIFYQRVMLGGRQKQGVSSTSADGPDPTPDPAAHADSR